MKLFATLRKIHQTQFGILKEIFYRYFSKLCNDWTMQYSKENYQSDTLKKHVCEI